LLIQITSVCSAELKFRNYVPRDPELKKGVIKIEEDIVKDVKTQFAKFGAVQEDEVSRNILPMVNQCLIFFNDPDFTAQCST